VGASKRTTVSVRIGQGAVLFARWQHRHVQFNWPSAAAPFSYDLGLGIGQRDNGQQQPGHLSLLHSTSFKQPKPKHKSKKHKSRHAKRRH
jgi:hypothetical protein